MSLLEKLSIYGLAEIEDLIFAGLVTGDPVLLVGRHGSAKTLLAKKLAECLGLKFIAYDASKALFDDVVGFPNPKSLSEGVLDYIPTPISIWDKEFVLIDEISRANTSMQNKWLEIIRSRQLMGKKISNLKYVFSAMNPPSIYSGAIVLDPALSGRFSFIISVPEIHQMKSADLKNIIKNISEDDAVALERSDGGAVNGEIKLLIAESQKIFPEIAVQHDKLLSNYISKLTAQFLLNKIKLDGRRLGMLRRNCIAHLAVKYIRFGKEETDNHIFDHIYDCVKYSIPDESTGEPIREDVIMSCHVADVKDTDNPDKYEIRLKVFCDNNLPKMIDNYIFYHKELSDIEHQEFVSILYEKREKTCLSPKEIVDLYLGMKKLVRFYQQNNSKSPIDVCRRTMDLYASMYSLAGVLPRIEIDRETRKWNTQIDFSDKNSEIAFRLTVNMNKVEKNRYSFSFNEKIYRKIKEMLVGVRNESIRY